MSSFKFQNNVIKLPQCYVTSPHFVGISIPNKLLLNKFKLKQFEFNWKITGITKGAYFFINYCSQ